jgi:hypothetical protein
MRQPVPFHKNAVGGEAAGVMHSMWYMTGGLSPGVAPTSGINGAAVSAPLAGQIPRTNPSSGNAYLARLAAAGHNTGTLVLCDRLWHNSGLNVTSTTAQAITPAALPPRDSNGTTNGEGVYAAVEWSAAGGAGTPTVTLTYTDQDGNTGATATLVGNATPAAGTFEIFSLASGDTGMRAPTSFIQSATRTSGTMHLILFRMLAQVELTSANIGNAIDVLTSGMPRIYDDSVLFFIFFPVSTVIPNLCGQYIETHG